MLTPELFAPNEDQAFEESEESLVYVLEALKRLELACLELG